MAVTRIKNNQITDATIVASAKLTDYSISAAKIANNLIYGSNLTVTGNLTVQGNTTAIDTNITTIEDPVILLASTQTGSPSVDIGFLGQRGTSTNIAFVWDESQGLFVSVFTDTTETASTVNITGYASVKVLDSTVTGNLAVTGNTSIGNLSVAGASIVDFGNVVIGNVANPVANSDAATKAYVLSQVSSSSINITDGSTTDAISGGDTIGFRSVANQTSVVVDAEVGTVANVNIGLANNVSVVGNVTVGNILNVIGTVSSNLIPSADSTYDLGADGALWRDLWLSGTSIKIGSQSITSNAAGIALSNSVSTSNVIATGTINATANITGGNVLTGGAVSATGTVTGGNLATGGTVSATGNVTGGNVATGGIVSATGNITGGNIDTAGTINSTGTVTGGNLATGGTVSATGNVTGGNVNTAGQVVATGNITGGNLFTAGQISAAGNVAGANVITSFIYGPTGITITAQAANSSVALVANGTGTVDVGNARITSVATPTTNSDAANKLYVDEVAQGLDVKASVNYATANTLTNLNGAYTYDNGTSGIGATITFDGTNAFSADGTAVSVGQRILVKNEAGAFVNNTTPSAAFNGIYQVTNAGGGGQSAVLTRTTDFDNGSPSGEIPGAFTFVEAGSTLADTGWVCTTNNPVTVGTTQIVWTQFSGAGQYIAGAGLTLTGTTFSVNVDNVTTAISLGNVVVKDSAQLTTPNIGAATGTSLSTTGNVTAGNVATGGTVDATGNITGGNILTGGIVSATGNATFGNISTAGSSGNISGANVISATTFTATGNVTGGNILTGGIVSATGTGTFGNIDTGSGYISTTGNVNGGNINTNSIVGTTLTVAATTITLNPTGNVLLSNRYINNLADPVQAQDAATKAYVDSVAQGLDPKASVLLASTTALPAYTYNNGTDGVGATITADANGALSLDGSQPTVGSRVLIKNETSSNAPVNGIYVVTTNTAGSPFVLTRATDMDTSTEFPSAFTFVETGSTLADTGWVCTTNPPVTVGTTAIVFTQFSGAGQYTANTSAGLSLTGTVFSAKVDEITTAFDGTGNIIVKASAQLTTPNIGEATGTTLSTTGTVTAGNIATGGTVSATGNITGGNILTGGIVSATGNITGGNVDTAGAVNATGNITGGNVITNNIIGTGITITSTGALNLAPTGNITANSKNINSLADPVEPQDAATKFYVDSVAQGLDPKASVVYATAAALPAYTYANGTAGVGATITADANGALSIDSGSPTAGQRVLIKNETASNAPYNGIYVVTDAGGAGAPFVLTRSSDMNQGSEFPSAFTFVEAGSTLADTGWVCTTNSPVTVGSTDITFVQFSGAGQYTANTSAGLSLTGTVFSAKVDQITTAFDGSGNIIVKAGAVLTTPNIGEATGTTLSTTGTVTAGNIATGGTASAAGNITGGNILTGGIVSATGNITGNYYFGNGSQLTGVIASSANAETLTGTFLANNVLGSSLTSVGDLTSLSVVGNTVSGNITTAGLISATGNITGGELASTGGIGAVGNIGTLGNINAEQAISALGNVVAGNVLTGGLISATANITGGNLTTGGLISATANITGGNILTAGVVSAVGNINGGNLITTGTGTFGNVVIGTEDVTSKNGLLYINEAGADVDFAVNGDLVANVLYVDAGTSTVSIGNNTQTTGAALAINASTSVLMPVGNTAARPTGVTGMLRFNSQENQLEVFDNSAWAPISAPEFTVVVDDQFNGDDSTVAFTLTQASTTAGTIVSINGVQQVPTVAYSVSGTTLTFTEAPATGDLIDARILTTTTSVTSLSNESGNAVVEPSPTSAVVNVTGDLSVSGSILGGNINSTQISNGTSSVAVVASAGNIRSNIAGATIQTISAGGLDITGNINPTANVTYDLGTTTNRWKDLWLSNSTIYMGNSTITANATSIVITNPQGGQFVSTGATGAAQVESATVSATGNITGSYFLGNGSQLTGIDATSIQNGTSSVSVIASGGNIRANVGGATIATTYASGLSVSGIVSATGNVTGGNILTTGLISATGAATVGSLTSGTASITGNLNITGNINATGNLNYQNVTDLVVGDPLIYLGANNVADLDDLGFVANWDNGTYQHGGFARDHTDGVWKVFGNVIAEPTTTIDFANAIYQPFRSGAATFSGANINGALTGATTISATGNITGGNLSVSTGTVTLGSIVNANANGVGNIGSSTTYFNTVFAKATSAQYADLAEKYTADAEYSAGTVVVFGGSKEVTVSAVDADTAVAGVISTNPSYIMNGSLEAEFVATVALTGRVPTKVTGAVKKGDLMVSAGNGLARAEANPKVGTVIGKALEDFNGTEGTIEVVVGRF